jgi:hypothetical protein
LTASTSTPRTPSEHRFLYWDPQPLVFNGIACPNCSVPLNNKGRIRSGPIKVYDLENPFFIIGCEYVCKSNICIANTSPEGRKFASTDWAILKSLPARLKDEFPAHLMQGESYSGSGPNVWNWQPLGVSRSLWNMVRGCLKVGLGKDAILQIAQAIQGGVSTDHEKMEEEEGDNEEEEEEEEEVLTQTVPQEETNASIRIANSTVPDNQDVSEMPAVTFPVSSPLQNTAEVYNNAWKANSVVANTAMAPPTTPGVSAPGNTVLSSGSVAGPSTQPFSISQTGPYANLPYAYYTYFQQHLSSQPSSSALQHPLAAANDPSHNTLKRPFAFAADGTGQSDATSLESSPKRTRHCCKCGSQDCKGKGGRSFCMNVCQDCGKLDCRGRNSRRPDKRCAEAWS